MRRVPRGAPFTAADSVATADGPESHGQNTTATESLPRPVLLWSLMPWKRDSMELTMTVCTSIISSGRCGAQAGQQELALGDPLKAGSADAFVARRRGPGERAGEAGANRHVLHAAYLTRPDLQRDFSGLDEPRLVPWGSEQHRSQKEMQP